MRKTRISTPGVPATWVASRARFAWRDPRIDALVDSYVEWREGCEAVGMAYGRWTQSERSRRDLAYAAYRAALDREEKAAADYQLAATRLVGAAGEQRQP